MYLASLNHWIFACLWSSSGKFTSTLRVSTSILDSAVIVKGSRKITTSCAGEFHFALAGHHNIKFTSDLDTSAVLRVFTQEKFLCLVLTLLATLSTGTYKFMVRLEKEERAFRSQSLLRFIHRSGTSRLCHRDK